MSKKDLRLERKKHRQEENRKDILRAAEKVFAQKGYSLATMDDIADEVQFCKATIYRYFKSKRDIFLEIVYSSFEEVYQKIEKIMQMELNAENKLRKIISHMSSYYYKKKNIARIYLMERAAMMKILNMEREKQHKYSNQHPQIPYKFKVMMSQISDIICEVIKEGIQSGEFRDVDVKDAAYVFRAMLRGFHFRGPMHDKEYRISESIDLLHSFFLHGIKKHGKSHQ